jgi:glycosyltransferase involved in cell wall biosynthesis
MERAVGVVVPAFRPDVDRLEAYVDAIHERLDPVVVRVELDDPGSGVAEAVRALPVEVAVADARRGKGAAVTAGFEALARGASDVDVLAFADADGSTPAGSLAAVVAAVDGGAALSVGSRRHPDADVRSHQTVARRRLGDGFAWLARRLLDVELTDYQCGAKAVDVEAWREVRDHLYEPGFAWDIELVAVTGALGYAVRERPVVWEDRPGSTVSPVATTLDMARGLLAARHRAALVRRDPLHRLLDAPRDSRRALVERDRDADPDREHGAATADD